MGDLDGKVAIITGAGRGLGRVEALQLAKQGARIVVNELGGSSQAEEAARSVVEEIKGFGGEAIPYFCDCADFAATGEMFKKALDTYGDVNIMINNAGFCRDGMIFNMEEDQFDSVIRVHLKGHFCNIRHATKYWRDKGKAAGGPIYGRLISTSSEAFIFGSVGQPNYAAAKAGIVAMTMSAAQAMIKYGVTANVIMPRARTDMTMTGPTAAIFKKPEQGFDNWDPANVSPFVGYLASPEAQNISGYVFVVWGKRVTVVDRPQIGTTFESDKVWTLDDLHSKLAGHFEKLTPVKDGFSVPPM